MAIANQTDFHNAIHGSVGSPSLKFATRHHHKSIKRREVPKIHTSHWAEASVNLASKTITVNTYIDYQQNSLTNAEYTNLRNLASRGINGYWSRPINLSGVNFHVVVRANHRKNNSIDVDLYIETSNSYARSHNSGIIDASFIYNRGFYRGMNANADRDFMLVSAHEFGHSVLEYFGSADLSWTHKGSTNKYLQNVKPTTPGYPSAGEIDLMKYYDRNKNAVSSAGRYTRTIADEKDAKRLVWMSKLTFTP